ncbi:MAG: aldolase catalytic domain-containing protein [Clostridia bacterium]|nr:aldolase catalytic domain-containing protein [Clostridia bacterium]
MKKRIQLLDCTLRDGGFVNDWKFGRENIISIFERIVDAGIDIIEIGLLDERRPFDPDRSIMPDTDSADKIYGKLDKKNAMVVGMIDYGTCDISNIKPCKDTLIDGIRVIFKKNLRVQALNFCKQLKDLGYKVFAQLVSVTSYSDEEIADLVKLANEVKPYAVSMVDTYGLMHQDNLTHYFELLHAGLNPEIGLGYHAHNNFQMGYANCITMLANDIDRDIIVDGSLYGMGKSAGNAPLELIAMHMNERYGKSYQIGQLLEAIDSNIFEFYRPATWGYNMFYYLAASNDCHPNYVAYLMDKRCLSVNSINEILGKLSGEKQLLFDKNYIEQLYLEYQNKEVNDKAAKTKLSKILKDKKILVLGPGVTINTQRDKILSFIAEHNPVVIAINYLPENLPVNFVFLSNSKRYVQLSSQLLRNKQNIIATSNITETGNNKFNYILNYNELIDRKAEVADNSLIMLLKALLSIKVNEVYLAGCDGYSSKKSNYFNTEMEYDFVKDKADYLNNYTVKFFADVADKLKVTFLTDSYYCGGGNE